MCYTNKNRKAVILVYSRKTISKEKVIEQLAEEYGLQTKMGEHDKARLCSIILYNIMGLRICLSSTRKEVTVFNCKNYQTEYRFNFNTGEEII